MKNTNFWQSSPSPLTPHAHTFYCSRSKAPITPLIKEVISGIKNKTDFTSSLKPRLNQWTYILNPNVDFEWQFLIEYINIFQMFQYISNIPIYFKYNIYTNTNVDFKLQVLLEYISNPSLARMWANEAEQYLSPTSSSLSGASPRPWRNNDNISKTYNNCYIYQYISYRDI